MVESRGICLGLIIAGAIVGYAGGMWWVPKSTMPVVAVICLTDSGKCTREAMFPDLSSCARYAKIGDMLCKDLPEGRKLCSPNLMPMATTHCENR